MEAEYLERELSALLGDGRKVSAGMSVRELHAHDGSLVPRCPPDVVAFPEDTQDVSLLMQFAHAHDVPVTPFGAGTSSAGKTVPLHGGISLDLGRMNAIVAIHPQDFDVVVQPGVLRKALNRRLADHGVFFPVDPGADASLGGMASTNASGTTTVRYGGMRRNVLGLEVVLADGTVVRTGTRAAKSSAGYDMTNLFVGAEGTLGVITELILRVHARPEQTVSARLAFGSLRAAARAVASLTGLSAVLSRLELLDGPTIAIVNAHFGTGLPEQPTLLAEYGGAPAAVAGDLELAHEVCRELRSGDIVVERDPTAQARLWDARHNFGHALAARHPGKVAIGTDICVPISRLPEAIEAGREKIAAAGLEACLVAHAGDGNFHFVVVVDPGSVEPVVAQEIYDEMVEHALSCGGTAAAEHGIGAEKLTYLVREHGDLVPAMHAIKDALDPRRILNPGKVLDETERRAA